MLVIEILAIIGCMVLLWYVRKAFRQWNESVDSAPPKGFTLGDLRDMRKKGQITEAEYERARAMIVDATKRQPAVPPKPTRPAGPLDKIIDAERRAESRPQHGRPTGGFPVVEPDHRPPTDPRF
jgi:hypothetical protein